MHLSIYFLSTALCYKPEGRGFDCRLGHCTFQSSRIMALVSSQPLIEMSTRNLPGGNGWPAHRAVSLTAICEPIV
jgi:hypothetical protein